MLISSPRWRHVNCEARASSIPHGLTLSHRGITNGYFARAVPLRDHHGCIPRVHGDAAEEASAV